MGDYPNCVECVTFDTAENYFIVKKTMSKYLAGLDQDLAKNFHRVRLQEKFVRLASQKNWDVYIHLHVLVNFVTGSKTR